MVWGESFFQAGFWEEGFEPGFTAQGLDWFGDQGDKKAPWLRGSGLMQEACMGLGFRAKAKA